MFINTNHLIYGSCLNYTYFFLLSPVIGSGLRKLPYIQIVKAQALKKEVYLRLRLQERKNSLLSTIILKWGVSS